MILSFPAMLPLAVFESALDRAVGALQELSNANRVVGIISHVPELKNRIERQIVIKKTKGKGSETSGQAKLSEKFIISPSITSTIKSPSESVITFSMESAKKCGAQV